MLVVDLVAAVMLVAVVAMAAADTGKFGVLRD
jgi:hypothetical protein